MGSYPVSLFLAVNNSPSVQIIGRKTDFYFIAWDNPNIVLAHLARKMGKNNVSIRQLDTEHRVGKSLSDYALHFDRFFFSHKNSYIYSND